MAERDVPGTGIGELALAGRRVRDLMTSPALTCQPGASITAAAALMTREGIGSLIVVGDGGAPVGIVTDRDLRSRVVARSRSASDPVAAIMSAPLITIEADRGALLRRATIAGSSEEIVESLLALRERAGIPVEFVARSYFPTLEYPAQVALMQELAEEVAPHI